MLVRLESETNLQVGLDPRGDVTVVELSCTASKLLHDTAGFCLAALESAREKRSPATEALSNEGSKILEAAVENITPGAPDRVRVLLTADAS
jgi:hypothetical protein